MQLWNSFQVQPQVKTEDFYPDVSNAGIEHKYYQLKRNMHIQLQANIEELAKGIKPTECSYLTSRILRSISRMLSVHFE